MKKLLLVSLCLLVLFTTQVFAQNRTITGTVTGKDDGLPLPGVSVRIKGTNTGTQTSSTGTYSINVPANGVLQFSFIGYVSMSIPVTSNTLNLSLVNDNKQLNEVVVTSLGIRREKRALGYSIQEVKGDDLVKAGETDAIKSLSGKVAGVQVTASTGTPGAAVYVQLRGATSFGDNQPLFVVDGIPVDNSFNQTIVGGGTQSTQTNRGVDINPDDIESISILKGPSAAALYGIKSANGAIIITTKKGQAGKAQVELNTGVSFSTVNKMPKLQNEYIKGLGSVLSSNSSYESTNRYSWGPKADTLFWNGIPNAYDQHGDIVGKSDPSAKIPFKPYDNLDNFFQTGASYNNSIAISGGTDQATYRTSVTNSYQNSIIPTEFYQRTTVAFAGSLAITPRLKASTNISYTGSNGNQPQTGSNLSGIMLGLTRTPISFDNSNGLKNPANNPAAYLLPAGQLNASGYNERDYRNAALYDNAYYTINENPYTTNVGRITGSFQLDYNIGGGFSALYRFGADNYQDNRFQYYEIGSGAVNGGEILEDRYTFRSINSDLILAYTKKLGEFQFDGKIGNNIAGSKDDELFTSGSGLVSPGFRNLANASTILSSDFAVPTRSYSFYYDLNLSYKSLLYLETTGRNDHVSTLPSNANSFFYPSANLSFVFTELGGLKNSDILNFGKIRASVSKVGYTPGAFGTSSGFNASSFADGFTTGIAYPLAGLASYSLSSGLGNPNLKPAYKTNYEFGVQLQFFKNLLGIDATYYHSTSKDLPISAPIASSTGYSSTVLNTGSIADKGFELQVTTNQIKGSNFNWSSFINFSLDRTKVLQLSPGVNELFLGGFGGGEAAIEDVPGAPANIIYADGYTNVGKKIVIDDQNNVGYPLSNTAVQKVIGNPAPKFLMGFGNTFTFKKKLSLYFLIDWKFKGDVWDGTRGSLNAIGTSAETANRNTPTVFQGLLGHINSSGQLVHYAADGTTELPGAGAANTKSVMLDQAWYQGDGGGFGNLDEAFIEDGSYVKLREITLSYDFKDLFFGKSVNFIKNLNVGLFARNIIIWTPYKGVDPETNLQGASTPGGIDYFNNPGTANYGFNIKVKF